jgi:hypothetical protein
VATNPNLELWDSVSVTDMNHTKKVNTRGGFTAIDAYYQFKCATERFGAVGVGWGWEVEWVEGPNCVIARVTLWHGNTDNKVPAVGCCTWGSESRVDVDAPKKALTDGITKSLSYLGFNSDIFMGLMDDNKYVQQQKQQPQMQQAPPQQQRPQARTESQPQGSAWRNQPVGFGKYGDLSWLELSKSPKGGDEHSYLAWYIGQDPEGGDARFHASNKERQARAIFVSKIIAGQPDAAPEPRPEPEPEFSASDVNFPARADRHSPEGVDPRTVPEHLSPIEAGSIDQDEIPF